MKRTAPEICPACGAEVPSQARACPECGADEKTGWNEEATEYDGLDLPDESTEYRDEVPSQSDDPQKWSRPKGLPWHWWLLGIALLVILAYAILTVRW
jgi:hypothetical protein